MSDFNDLMSHVVLPSTVEDLRERLQSGRLSKLENYISYGNKRELEIETERNLSEKSSGSKKFQSLFRARHTSSGSKPKSRNKYSYEQPFIHPDYHTHIVKSRVQCPDCGKVFLNELKLPENLSGFKVENLNNMNDQCTKKSHIVKQNSNLTDTVRYECSICDRVFSRKENYTKHLQCHLKVMRHKCNVCSESFSSKSLLINHHVVHGLYTCKKCKKCFPDKWKLTRHNKTHLPSKCSKCNIVFSRKIDLFRHMRTHVNETVENISVTPEKNLAEHMEVHVLEKQEEMPCQYVSDNSYDVKLFTGLHMCTFCGKSFRDKYGLNRHVAIHTNAVKHMSTYTDKTCENKNVISAESNLTESLATVLEKQELSCQNMSDNSHEVKLFSDINKCTFCGCCFKDKDELNCHMAIHTSTVQHSSTYTDKKCEDRSVVSGKSNLTDPLVSFGLEKQEISCQNLPDNSHKVELFNDLHMCTFCGKNFKDKFELSCHMAIHTNAIKNMPTYTDKTCENKSIISEKSDLTEHLKTHVHEQQEVPCQTVSDNLHEVELFSDLHQCTFCEKHFKDKYDLNCHMTTHTDKVEHIITHTEKTCDSEGAIPEKSNFTERMETSVLEKQEAFCQRMLDNSREVKIVNDMHKCTICGKCFGNKWKLNRHEAIHTKVVKSVLTRTVKTLKKKSVILEKPNLMEHSATHMPGKQEVSCQNVSNNLLEVKPSLINYSHKCTLCGKSFKDNYSLNRHALIHTGEKPHACNICSLKFLHKYQLTRHLKTHANKNIPISSVSNKNDEIK